MTKRFVPECVHVAEVEAQELAYPAQEAQFSYTWTTGLMKLQLHVPFLWVLYLLGVCSVLFILKSDPRSAAAAASSLGLIARMTSRSPSLK